METLRAVRDGLVRLWRTEPIRVLGIVESAVVAGVAFGLDISAEQTTAVMLLAASLLGVQWQVARNRVSPVGD